MKIIINLNEKVKVRLNKIGLDELERQHKELKKKFLDLPDFELPETDEDGYVEFQLHDLMGTLGHLCGVEFSSPFDLNILFENSY